MAFPRPYHLTNEQVRELLSAFSPTQEFEVTRFRRKNKDEIRRTEIITVEDLERSILKGMESSWGSDLEVFLPSVGKTLIGHHDGVYWLEPKA